MFEAILILSIFLNIILLIGIFFGKNEEQDFVSFYKKYRVMQKIDIRDHSVVHGELKRNRDGYGKVIHVNFQLFKNRGNNG